MTDPHDRPSNAADSATSPRVDHCALDRLIRRQHWTQARDAALTLGRLLGAASIGAALWSVLDRNTVWMGQLMLPFLGAAVAHGLAGAAIHLGLRLTRNRDAIG